MPENGKKTTVGLISKKSNFAFLYISLLLFCTTQRETSRNFLVTRFMDEMLYVFLFTFFSLPLIFTLHWWLLAFPILSPPLQNFAVVFPTKKCLLNVLMSLYSKFVDMTINLN